MKLLGEASKKIIQPVMLKQGEILKMLHLLVKVNAAYMEVSSKRF